MTLYERQTPENIENVYIGQRHSFEQSPLSRYYSSVQPPYESLVRKAGGKPSTCLPPDGFVEWFQGKIAITKAEPKRRPILTQKKTNIQHQNIVQRNANNNT